MKQSQRCLFFKHFNFKKYSRVRAMLAQAQTNSLLNS